MFTRVTVKVIQSHVADNLLKHDVVFVFCDIFGEVVSEYRDLLVRTTLTPFDVPNKKDENLYFCSLGVASNE